MPIKNGSFLSCPVCNNQFYRPKSQQWKNATCSRKCCDILSSGIYGNEEKAVTLYQLGKSLAHIRHIFKCDSGTLATMLRSRGIEIRDQGYYSSGERNHNYKGGGISKEGYKTICVNGKMRFEHRMVMEEFLKRELLSNEHVHHMNGDKLDNRLENLAVLTPYVHGRISAKQYMDWRKMYQARIAELEALLSK